jgi:peptide/nickel transport system permease protein
VSVAMEAFAEGGIVEHRRGFARRWYRTPSFVAGVSILGVIVLLAIFAPLVAQSPTHQDLLSQLQGPSWHHPLGTDDLGRDVWARLVFGARTDLHIAFLAVLFPFCIGTVIGLFAGYYGGWLDLVVGWLVNTVVAFPFFVLIIALAYALGPGSRSIYIAITIVGWVSYARIVRGEVLVAKRREYVLAARAAGLPDRRILFRHLLPNTITQAIVFSMSDVVLDILAIVTLGYLGIGVQPPTADWGQMIAEGRGFLTTNWELATLPGIAVVITALALALIADGLADLLRPE